MGQIIHGFERIKPKDWRGQPAVVAQAKLDGFRLTIIRTSSNRFMAYGRDWREDLEYLTRFPRIRYTPWFQSLRYMPLESAVDGEVYVPGRPASDVPTALRDDSLPLDFKAFAIPYWGGRERFQEAVDWPRSLCEDLGVSFARWLALSLYGPFTGPDGAVYSPPVANDPLGALEDRESSVLEWQRLHGGWGAQGRPEPRPWQTVRDDLHKHAKQLGYEGWVLKQRNFGGWYKVKEAHTLDAVVMGLKEGRGKYDGMVGALIIGLYDEDGRLKRVASVSGMTEEERWDMTIEDDKLIGRVCEVKYQYVGSGGQLRHPRFVRWRPDKPAEECKLSDLEEAKPW